MNTPLEHVLLIDDYDAGRLLMRKAFRASGLAMELHEAEDAGEALRFLKREPPFAGTPTPGLILLDLNLPGKTGLELLEEIKSDGRLRGIPVAILTGSSSSADMEACAKMGCRYLTKPLRFEGLVDLVKSLPGYAP
jgi:CheY-like chemotaxis protein